MLYCNIRHTKIGYTKALKNRSVTCAYPRHTGRRSTLRHSRTCRSRAGSRIDRGCYMGPPASHTHLGLNRAQATDWYCIFKIKTPFTKSILMRYKINPALYQLGIKTYR